LFQAAPVFGAGCELLDLLGEPTAARAAKEHEKALRHGCHASTMPAVRVIARLEAGQCRRLSLPGSGKVL
jgi:hypothetical protein